MTSTVEFIQRISYVEIRDEKGEMQTYAIPETAEDVQELVRCKDCKHGRVYNNGQLVACEYQELSKEPDWFCADGERRTG